MAMPPPAARCCATAARSLRHMRTSCPAKLKSPAAAKAPLPPPSTAIRMLALLRVRRRLAGCGPQQLLEAKMLHLAHGIARQAVDPNILARNLVACELRQTKAFDLRQITARTRTPHHVGDGHLLPLCIGAPDNRGLGDRRVLIEHPL